MTTTWNPKMLKHYAAPMPGEEIVVYHLADPDQNLLKIRATDFSPERHHLHEDRRPKAKPQAKPSKKARGGKALGPGSNDG